MRAFILRLPPLAAAALAFGLGLIYAIVFMEQESDVAVISLVAFAAAAAVAAGRIGLIRRASLAAGTRPGAVAAMGAGLALALIAVFAEDHFPLLMLATVMLYATAALGLNVQFGYTGVVNFAGAAFFGIGAYTSAELIGKSVLPPILVLPLGGLIAAAVGLVLVFPVVRTRGHYAAVVTIAFSVLFKTFLEVNDTLGGPQGLSVDPVALPGWSFADGPVIFGVETSFYLNYALAALVVLGLAFIMVRRLERSWIGLSLDAVRLDETASACYGIPIRRAKILAFVAGNLIIGVAGALYGSMLGYVAPTSFTFSDSLILVAIVLLGGMGSPWGTILAAAIVVILPEKLQAIQEYRFLLFSVVVMAILLFRPEGLLPRAVRRYLPVPQNEEAA
ncbi:MAG: branched-chain amino acid ABC transporter permease [Rhodospirillaceae bacterium]